MPAGTVSGTYFSVTGSSNREIEFFGLRGSLSGARWKLGFMKYLNSTNEPIKDFFQRDDDFYALDEIRPAPISDAIRSLTLEAYTSGTQGEIALLMVDNRALIRLWLEGVVEMWHFENAEEFYVGDVFSLSFSLVPPNLPIRMPLVAKTALGDFVVSSPFCGISDPEPRPFTIPRLFTCDAAIEKREPRVTACVVLPGVRFGRLELPVIVMSERVLGSSYARFLDGEGRVI